MRSSPIPLAGRQRLLHISATRKNNNGSGRSNGRTIGQNRIQGRPSMTRHSLYSSVAIVALAALLGGAPAPVRAQQAAQAVAIDSDDIGGVVTSPKGPEAGVWVIAVTTDLPTKFVKIVVTDDRGRYLVPQLPKA